MHNIFMPGLDHPRREHTAFGIHRATRGPAARKTTPCCTYLPYRIRDIECTMPTASPRRELGRRPRGLMEGEERTHETVTRIRPGACACGPRRYDFRKDPGGADRGSGAGGL